MFGNWAIVFYQFSDQWASKFPKSLSRIGAGARGRTYPKRECSPPGGAVGVTPWLVKKRAKKRYLRVHQIREKGVFSGVVVIRVFFPQLFIYVPL